MLHWVKFNLVGLLGFALQTGVLFVFTHVTPQVSYLAATATAVELAVLNNFVWHQRWTWKDRPSLTIKDTLRRLAFEREQTFIQAEQQRLGNCEPE